MFTTELVTSPGVHGAVAVFVHRRASIDFRRSHSRYDQRGEFAATCQPPPSQSPKQFIAVPPTAVADVVSTSVRWEHQK